MTGKAALNATWRKSSYSGSGNNCVEASFNLPDIVAVRDSKNLDGPALAFTPAQWRAFTARIKAGHATQD